MEIEGRELDALVAERVMGHKIVGQRKGTIKERTRQGQVRPLRCYSSDISAAWEIVRKFGITIIPVQEGKWFALAGNESGWESPADFLKFLQSADFVRAGAAVANSAPMTICLAALRAVEKREGTSEAVANSEAQPEVLH